MINKLHQLAQQGAGKAYSLPELCRWFKLNRAWHYQGHKLNEQPGQVENELKPFVEALLKEYTGYGVRRVTKALWKAGK